jgi:hypothetical protein
MPLIVEILLSTSSRQAAMILLLKWDVGTRGAGRLTASRDIAPREPRSDRQRWGVCGDRNLLDWTYRDAQSAHPHELLSPIREAIISDLNDLKTIVNRRAGRLFLRGQSEKHQTLSAHKFIPQKLPRSSQK